MFFSFSIFFLFSFLYMYSWFELQLSNYPKYCTTSMVVNRVFWFCVQRKLLNFSAYFKSVVDVFCVCVLWNMRFLSWWWCGSHDGTVVILQLHYLIHCYITDKVSISNLRAKSRVYVPFNLHPRIKCNSLQNQYLTLVQSVNHLTDSDEEIKSTVVIAGIWATC